MSPLPEPVPSATGTLSRRPFPHLLVYMLDRTLDGSIRLVAGDGSEHVIYFSRGLPAKARTAYSTAHLGRVLLELGFIDQATLDSTLVTLAQSRQLHGQILLSLGKIDRAQLVAGLKEQTMRRLVHMFESLDVATSYSFYSQVNLIDDFGGPELTPVDTLRVLWAGMRARPDQSDVNVTLARVSTAPLHVRSAAQDLVRFGFGKDELDAIEVMRVRPMPLSEIVGLGLLSERTLKLMLYLLLITRHLDLGKHERPPVGAEPSSPMPSAGAATTAATDDDEEVPSSRRTTALARIKMKSVLASTGTRLPIAEQDRAADAKLEGLREMIRSRAETIQHEDFFTVLRVDKDTQPDALQSAYFSLAKQFHPDSLPPALSDTRPLAEKCFNRISDAFQTLSDPDRRATYTALLNEAKADPEEQEKVRRIVDATIDFQKADVLVRKRDMAQALEHAKRAYDGDPDQPDYAALYAWVLAAQPEREKTKDFTEPLRLLNQAAERGPRCERAFFYRAMLLQRIGKIEASIRDFRTVVEINPRNIDAARAIRLHEMRRSSPSKGKEAPTAKGSNSERPEAKGGESINWTQDGLGTILNKLLKR